MTGAQPKPIIGKGGKFLWTRRQVLEVLEAQRADFEVIIEQQRNQITGLLAELDEARNVVRSVVRTAGQLDSVLTNWLASKDPKVEEAEAPTDATSDPGGVPGPTIFDEAGPYPVGVGEGVKAAARRAAEKVLAVVADLEADDHHAADGDAPRELGPMFLHVDEDSAHVHLDPTQARLVAVSRMDAAVTYSLDGAPEQILHRSEHDSARELILFRNEHRARVVTFFARRHFPDGTFEERIVTRDVAPWGKS